MLAAVKEAETDQKITEWIAANMPTIDAMAKAAPKVHKRLMAAIEQQAKSFVAPSIPLIDEDPEDSIRGCANMPSG